MLTLFSCQFIYTLITLVLVLMLLEKNVVSLCHGVNEQPLNRKLCITVMHYMKGL